MKEIKNSVKHDDFSYMYIYYKNFNNYFIHRNINTYHDSFPINDQTLTHSLTIFCLYHYLHTYNRKRNIPQFYIKNQKALIFKISKILIQLEALIFHIPHICIEKWISAKF